MAAPRHATPAGAGLALYEPHCRRKKPAHTRVKSTPPTRIPQACQAKVGRTSGRGWKSIDQVRPATLQVVSQWIPARRASACALWRRGQDYHGYYNHGAPSRPRTRWFSTRKMEFCTRKMWLSRCHKRSFLLTVSEAVVTDSASDERRYSTPWRPCRRVDVGSRQCCGSHAQGLG